MDKKCLDCKNNQCFVKSYSCDNYKPLCCLSLDDDKFNEITKIDVTLNMCKNCKYYDKSNSICLNKNNYINFLDGYQIRNVSEYDSCPFFKNKTSVFKKIIDFFKNLFN